MQGTGTGGTGGMLGSGARPVATTAYGAPSHLGAAPGARPPAPGGPPSLGRRPGAPARSTPWLRVAALVVLGVLLVVLVQRTRSSQVLVDGVPSGAPSAVEASARLLPVVPAPDNASSAYAFLDVGSDGRPVTWSPCRPIRVVVRAENMPAGARELLDSALARLSQATGLAVVDEGLTDEPIDRARPAYQPERYGDRWAPVLVVWGKRTDLSEFMTDVAGMAGPRTAQGPDGRRAYVSGTVFLDAEKYTELTAQWGSLEIERSVILHELGHLVGLGHVPAGTELMNPSGVAGTPFDYRAGDRTGLAALGDGPCVPGL